MLRMYDQFSKISFENLQALHRIFNILLTLLFDAEGYGGSTWMDGCSMTTTSWRTIWGRASDEEVDE